LPPKVRYIQNTGSSGLMWFDQNNLADRSPAQHLRLKVALICFAPSAHFGFWICETIINHLMTL